MKTHRIMNIAAVIATILAASWIMGVPLRAEIAPELEMRAISNQIYERIPGLWEYLQGYKIEWAAVNESALEPNDADTTATLVGGFTEVSGSIDATTDVNDYFKVELTEPSTVIAQLKWTSSAWINLYLYDSTLEPITYLNENTPSPKTISFYQKPAGIYYIRVKALAGSSNYTLKVGVGTQIAETQNDAYDTTDAYVGAFHEPVMSVIADGADTVDYYIVSIPGGCEGATISLDWLGSNESNLDFEIYNDSGVKLMTSANSSSYETLYSQNVPQGMYYVAVKAISGGRAIYQLDVDAEVNIRIEIPKYYYEVEIWNPPFPEFELRNRVIREIQ